MSVSDAISGRSELQYVIMKIQNICQYHNLVHLYESLHRRIMVLFSKERFSKKKMVKSDYYIQRVPMRNVCKCTLL